MALPNPDKAIRAALLTLKRGPRIGEARGGAALIDDYIDAVRHARKARASGGRTNDDLGRLEKDLGRLRAAHPDAPSRGGLPGKVKIPGYGLVATDPVPEIEAAAQSYMKKRGFHARNEFSPFNEAFARKVATAFDRLKNKPNDPKVKRAYDALIDETLDQYNALKNSGLEFKFLKEGQKDPYAASPSLGYADLMNKGRLWVFPTDTGFGSGVGDSTVNPLLKRVGKIGDLPNATANDAFRIVHDAYGHFGPGNPFFRAPGEERAYQKHASMYGPEARKAATTETRGQNSWVNAGPFAEHNKNASGADTIYAPQKAALLPAWAMKDPPLPYADGGPVDPADPAQYYPAMKTPAVRTTPTPPVEPVTPAAGITPSAAPLLGGLPGGSANAATGSGGDATGGASGSGGIGGSAEGSVGGSAAAGVGGDDGGTYSRGGEAMKAGGTPDAPTPIDDWQWRPIDEVRNDLGGLNEIPSHVAAFGDFMDATAHKAMMEGLSPRDLIKAYTITRSSIQRGAVSVDKARAAGLPLPPTMSGKIRPEGAFGTWLHTPMGQRYLDAAENGDLDEEAIADAVRIMAPFGKHEKDIPDALRWAALNLPGQEGRVSELVARARKGQSHPSEWRDQTASIKGIGPAKSGFYASMLGRGDQPTLDARQIVLNTGQPTKAATPYLRPKGAGEAVVNRLADRQTQLGLKHDPKHSPYYQHLAHHAVWDTAAGEQTTHDDVKRAMMGAKRGGAVDPAGSTLDHHPVVKAMRAAGLPKLWTSPLKDAASPTVRSRRH